MIAHAIYQQRHAALATNRAAQILPQTRTQGFFHAQHTALRAENEMVKELRV
jgi:hypothetical protein